MAKDHEAIGALLAYQDGDEDVHLTRRDRKKLTRQLTKNDDKWADEEFHRKNQWQ